VIDAGSRLVVWCDTTEIEELNATFAQTFAEFEEHAVSGTHLASPFRGGGSQVVGAITMNDDESTGDGLTIQSSDDGEYPIAQLVAHLTELLTGVHGNRNVLLVDHLLE
jgi:hypothetical protein